MDTRTKKQLRLRNGTGGLDERIRVLEIVGNAAVGGMEMSVQNLIQRLPRDQFEVVAIAPYESPFTTGLRCMGVPVYLTPIEDDPRWRSVQMAVEAIKLHHVDVVHAHMPKAHVLAGLAGNLTDTPAMATVHGMNITSHELGITRTLGTNLITVCQEAYTQALAMGIPLDRVSMIHNGVDLDQFSPQGDGTAFRQTVGIPLDAPLVGFVGRLEHEKGPDFFVRAAHRAHKVCPDAYFVLVGEGGLRPELEALVEQFGLGERLRFAGVWDNPGEVYPALDVLAQTSRSEGMPLVLLEAMASGRPIVAMMVGGVREMVENQRSGLISHTGDWEGVGDRLIELIRQPERRRVMGQAARQRAETMFDLNLSVHRTAELLRRLAQPDSARAWRTAAVGD